MRHLNTSAKARRGVHVFGEPEQNDVWRGHAALLNALREKTKVTINPTSIASFPQRIEGISQGQLTKLNAYAPSLTLSTSMDMPEDILSEQRFRTVCHEAEFRLSVLLKRSPSKEAKHDVIEMLSAVGQLITSLSDMSIANILATNAEQETRFPHWHNPTALRVFFQHLPLLSEKHFKTMVAIGEGYLSAWGKTIGNHGTHFSSYTLDSDPELFYLVADLRDMYPSYLIPYPRTSALYQDAVVTYGETAVFGNYQKMTQQIAQIPQGIYTKLFNRLPIHDGTDSKNRNDLLRAEIGLDNKYLQMIVARGMPMEYGISGTMANVIQGAFLAAKETGIGWTLYRDLYDQVESQGQFFLTKPNRLLNALTLAVTSNYALSGFHSPGETSLAQLYAMCVIFNLNMKSLDARELQAFSLSLFAESVSSDNKQLVEDVAQVMLKCGDISHHAFKRKKEHEHLIQSLFPVTEELTDMHEPLDTACFCPVAQRLSFSFFKAQPEVSPTGRPSALKFSQ